MLRGETGASEAELDAFIRRWSASEGAERAAYAQFLNEFCALIGVSQPQPPTRDAEAVSYRFEYPVKLPDPAGTHVTGRIDLYKRGCFVSEAKQSRMKGKPKELLAADDRGDTPADIPRGRRGADRAWDVMMRHAKRQAEQYARMLPPAHGWPPFIARAPAVFASTASIRFSRS